MKINKYMNSLGLVAGVFLALAAITAPAQPPTPDKEKDSEKTPPAKRGRPEKNAPVNRRGLPVDSSSESKRPTSHSRDSSTEDPSHPSKNTTERSTEKTTTTTSKTITTVHESATLHTKTTAGGAHERVTSSGQVREKEVIKSDGTHTQHFAPTGRMQTEVIVKSGGVQETKHFAPNGKVEKTVILKPGGVTEVEAVRYGHDGRARATETVVVEQGREVSKTVVIKENITIVHNTTYINVAPVERHYDRFRFGFVYRPIFTIESPVFVSWYDPYWYSPAGVVVVHPFRYSWGWDNEVWYRRHHHYWATYEVYPTPSYWVTDWMIAGYAADHYAASISVEQAREDARLAREDAEKARAAAEKAQEQAEIAEAHAAQQAAEARAARAEAKIAQLQAAEASVQAGKPNPTLAPIDPQTKEQLRLQVEQTVADKKAYAEQAAKGGNPVPPDVSKALADPKHVYPISSSINVISATDSSPAGTLSEGDLIKLEPGQEDIIKNADENTFIKMRVLTSKGEDGEAQAGTVVSLPLKTVQDSDSEFRAKLDQGLAEADKNKDQFKTGAQ